MKLHESARYPKFADLPQEAEEEVRGLDEARRRITELERQIKYLKSTGAAARPDQAAIDRSLKVAVERERAAWQRQLGKGRARVRAMAAAATSAEQVLRKLKVLLQEDERESTNVQAAVATPDLSLNHRSESTAKPSGKTAECRRWPSARMDRSSFLPGNAEFSQPSLSTRRAEAKCR